MREETAPGSPDVAIAKPVPAPTVQQQVGNQAMQRNRASVATANAKRPPDQQDSVALSPLDQALADAKAASDLLELVESTLFPAYRHAVDALDPIAALELGRNVVGSMKVAERGSRNVASTLSGNDYHHFLVSDPRYADESEPSIAAKFAALESYNLYLTSKISLLQLTLAGKIGPQMFRDKPVLGDFTVPQLGQDPDAYLADEAGTAVELISLVREVLLVSNAQSGTCPLLTTEQAEQIIALLEPWKSRPVNFAFLVSVLTEESIWPAISNVQGKTGKTLNETNEAALKQAKQTGALADIGELGTDNLYSLFGMTPGAQEEEAPDIDDETAMKIFEKLRDAAPDARGPLIRQIQGMQALENLCDHLPWKYVQAMHDSIVMFDAQAANMLVPFYQGKGGGKSMHQIYMDEVDEDLKGDHTVRAFGWFFLDFLHNAFTGGFEREYSDAYDAREGGWITDDQFHSAAGKALGKAAVITAASALTGGAAGEFGEGLAAGLGASKSAAQIIGGAVGGFAGGVGGHLAGDVYDQALSGKRGFDTFGQYMQSGALGGITGTIVSGISVAGGKYLPNSRPIDNFAQKYPRMAKVLEDIRGSGFRTGSTVRMKVADLLDIQGSGLGGPGSGGAFAYAGAYSDVRALPPDTEVNVNLRPLRPMTEPMQMSSDVASGTAADVAGETTSAAGSGKVGSEKPFVEIEKVEVVQPKPAAQTSAPESVIENEAAQASVIEPEAWEPATKVEPGKRPTVFRRPSQPGAAKPKQPSGADIEEVEETGTSSFELDEIEPPLDELTGPDRLSISNTSSESIARAQQAGLPESIYGDGTVVTQHDFPDILPDRPVSIGRPAPQQINPSLRRVSPGRTPHTDVQNTEVQADILLARQAGADPASIRVNQRQVVEDLTAGTNRPDLYFEIRGNRIHIEYDRFPMTRAIEHARRILTNDPGAIVILKGIGY
jgi:hypothetical protein